MLTHGSPVPVPPARVVVIGAGGFIGGAIVTRLQREGLPLLALERRQVDLLAAEAGQRLAAQLLPGDAVVAAAAIAPVKTAAMLADNLKLVQAILTALARVPVAQVINLGSDAVYADLPQPLTEASTLAPGTLHGAMHLARELMFAAEVKAPLATLRPTLVYGARDPHNGYGPNRFRRQANRGEAITLFGEGEERRDHVLVDDVAELVLRMLHRRSTGVLNAATGTVTSFRALAEAVSALAPHPVAVRGGPRSGPMPHNGYRPFDPAATFQAFPDFTYTPLAEGLRQAQEQEFSHG